MYILAFFHHLNSQGYFLSFKNVKLPSCGKYFATDINWLINTKARLQPILAWKRSRFHTCGYHVIKCAVKTLQRSFRRRHIAHRSVYMASFEYRKFQLSAYNLAYFTVHTTRKEFKRVRKNAHSHFV